MSQLPFTGLERLVTKLYADVDAACARELARLEREAGIVPACAAGCGHCCWGEVRTDPAEAHTLARFIRRTFSDAQFSELRHRTHQWHQWDKLRRGLPQATALEARVDLSGYEPSCPLLVDDRCIAYAARPVVCRTHYVSSPPQLCEAAKSSSAAAAAPSVLTSVVDTGKAAVDEMRAHVIATGVDYSRSINLLPHGLALELGWSFAIES